jgi:hypothetical protein
MSSTTWVRRFDDPRAHAEGIIDAVAKGETVLRTAYASANRRPWPGRHRKGLRRLDGVDPVLHAIHALVSAELPAVQCSRLHYRGGERVWVWSLAEPQGVAFWPRQKPVL